MKYVGEAVSRSLLDYGDKQVLLGVTNWTTVMNNELLIRKQVSDMRKLHRICLLALILNLEYNLIQRIMLKKRSRLIMIQIPKHLITVHS